MTAFPLYTNPIEIIWNTDIYGLNKTVETLRMNIDEHQTYIFPDFFNKISFHGIILQYHFKITFHGFFSR